MQARAVRSSTRILLRSVSLPALLAALGGTASAATPVTIGTDEGAVVGSASDGVASFLGVPYAAPPVGDLRLRAPQPHAPWTTPIAATSYSSPCPQGAQNGAGPVTDEDCLYLNVWAPAVPSPPKPVMVFVHGGSYNFSSGSGFPIGDYSGVDIARKSGVVVVTINYRLGVLGFLTAPALDTENPRHVSGNYGLLDQQAALAWVKRNIARFGGDPHNVTLFGESAGAGSVLNQIISPSAAGLFDRAIAESGGDSLAAPLAASETTNASVISALGCGGASDVAGCLRALPVSTIVNSGQFAGPNIDGVVLPQLPTAVLATGKFNHVPTIIGTNANDGSYFAALAALGAGRAITASDFDAAIAANFGSAAAQIEAAYPLSAYPTPGDALGAVDTDNTFACPSERVRGLLATHQVPVWSYQFDQPNPVPNNPVPQAPGVDPGSSHTTELAYVFGHDGTGKPLTGNDLTLSNEIIRYWTSFAASGNPNFRRPDFGGWFTGPYQPSQAPAFWPRFRTSQPVALSLKFQPTTIPDFATQHHCTFWASLGNPEALILSLPQ